MKFIKKCTLFLTAALIAASVGAFAACGGNDGGSSSLGDSSQSSVNESQDSSSSSSSSSSSQQQPVEPEDNLEDDSLFVFPEDDAEIDWITLDDLNGTGHAYIEGNKSPYYATVGYYEVELTKKGKENGYTHFNFSIPQSGQYALYTLSDATGVTLINYPHNPQYVNYATGEDTHALKSGKLYCLYNMDDVHFSNDMLIDFAFKCTANTTLKFRFVRVGEPINPPEDIVTYITATEIQGKAGKPKYKKGVVVPYETEYFFDETATIEVIPFEGGDPVTVSGFYRTGTPQEPGEIIYAAINAPNRLLNCAFADLYSTGNGICLEIGKDPNTSASIQRDYVDFITNDNGLNKAEDVTLACYENAANEDGYYPVNAEIYAFLQDYLLNQSPYFGDEYEDGEEPEESTWWLSVCYTYQDVIMGTAENPIELVEGSNTIALETPRALQYYNFKATGANAYYTISCTQTNAYIVMNGTNYAAPFTLTFETNAEEGKTFSFKSADGSIATFDVSITPYTQSGTYPNPVILSNTGTTQIQPVCIYPLEYSEDATFEVYAVCQITLTEGNKLTITAEGANVEILAGADENGVYELLTSEENPTPTAVVKFIITSNNTNPVQVTTSTSTVE